jgi:hypothetical protein
VTAVRALVRANPAIAAILVVMAFALRVLMPAGSMPTITGGQLTVTVCDGTAPMKMVIQIPGLEHKSDGQSPQNTCAFSDLSMSSLAGADPIQLAELVLFLMAAGLVLVVAAPPLRAGRLRPPLLGPPLRI